jgi:hypothetical protein
MAIQETTPGLQRAELPKQLRPIVEQLLLEARIAAEKAVAHISAPRTYPLPQGGGEPTLEHVLAQRLKELSASRRKRAEERVMPSVRADAVSRTKRYGELANIDLRSTTPIAVQAAELHTGLTLSTEALLAITGATSDPAAHPSLPDDSAAALIVVPKFKRLQVLLRTVKCWDETDGVFGSEAGDDEISLAGIAHEPDGGIVKIAPFVVRDDFDTDELKDYNPPKVLASFDLAADNTMVYMNKTLPVTWPRTYGFTFMLAEGDNGGFPGFVTDVYKKVQAKAQEKIAKLVQDDIKKGTGEVLGRDIAKVVQAVVGSVLDEFLAWLKSVWEDDEFTPVTSYVTRPNRTWDFNNVPMGTKRIAYPPRWEMVGFGGRYDVYFAWQLVP